MAATHFGQDDQPDSHMNGQEPQHEDSPELSAHSKEMLISNEMPPSITVADTKCQQPQSPYLISTQNQITPLKMQGADQTLSAFTGEPQLLVHSQ